MGYIVMTKEKGSWTLEHYDLSSHCIKPTKATEIFVKEFPMSLKIDWNIPNDNRYYKNRDEIVITEGIENF